MKYAIEELRHRARIFNSTVLKDHSEELTAVADSIERVEFIRCSDEIIMFLGERLTSVLDGLSGWGSGYEEQRKRQEKRAFELNAAIEFLRPLCSYCGNRTVCEGTYPEGCFLENEIQSSLKQK